MALSGRSGAVFDCLGAVVVVVVVVVVVKSLEAKLLILPGIQAIQEGSKSSRGHSWPTDEGARAGAQLAHG